MNKFFVPNEIYEDRIAICKECTYYLWTGQCKKCLCFMKVKARIAPMSCPIKKWNKTTEIEIPEELPTEIIEEVLLIWNDVKTKRAKDGETKVKMIELVNIITGSNYSTNTNCGSCLSSCYDIIKKTYNKYKK
jgi:hypothetical protein